MALPAISLPPVFDAGPDLHPPAYPGRTDELVMAPDGLPTRVVKAHNANKKHYIERYTGIVAAAMKNNGLPPVFDDTLIYPRFIV